MPTPGTARANPENPHIEPSTPPPLVKEPKPTEATKHGTTMREITEADSPARKLSLLSGMLGPVEIKGVIKYRSEPRSYVMDTNYGKIRFDKTEDFTGQASFRNHVFAVTGRMIPQMKRGDWDDILNTLGDVMDEQEVANDATDEGMIASYLVHYLGDRPPTENEADAFRTQSSFMKDNDIYIFGSALRMWIYANYRHTLTAREFGLMMRNIGAKERTIGFAKPKGGRTTRYCWAVPAAVVAAVLGE
jgi:hypothetical protein